MKWMFRKAKIHDGETGDVVAAGNHNELNNIF